VGIRAENRFLLNAGSPFSFCFTRLSSFNNSAFLALLSETEFAASFWGKMKKRKERLVLVVLYWL
jgi:hypothetical protein